MICAACHRIVPEIEAIPGIAFCSECAIAEAARLRLAVRFWSKVNRAPGQGPRGECWEWTAHTVKGYGSFNAGQDRIVYAHRFAYELTTGPIPEGEIIRHTCDNPPCCRPVHLIPGTKLENTMDAIERGRLKPIPVMRGADHPGAVLSEAEVVEIRRRYQDGASLIELARSFGISDSHVHRLVTGQNWKHLNLP